MRSLQSDKADCISNMIHVMSRDVQLKRASIRILTLGRGPGAYPRTCCLVGFASATHISDGGIIVQFGHLGHDPCP